tara:strand:- start:35288 stop:35680 length:393 start_codon:yes stop_codon:yes gene_type:complete
MNRYRVTVTVFSAESFDREVHAVDEDAARRFAEASTERNHPEATEILVDDVELLDAAPEPTPDPLAQARRIIAGLLDAANQGSENWHELAECAAEEADDEAVTGYRARERDADAAITAARAFLATKEPPT